MARCFPLYLSDLAALWFRQLENGSVGSWTELAKKFIRQFWVHIVRPKNMMTLTTIKQRPGEMIRAFLTRFNTVVASVDRPDPSMVLMAAVSGIAEKTDFMKSLARDPPRDLGEYYLEAERFMRQEDAEVEERTSDGEVFIAEKSSGGNPDKDKGKGKRKAGDGYNRPKRQWKEPKFPSYADLNESLERIYMETREGL